MKKILIVLAIVILLSGCAPYLRVGCWTNPNVSHGQFFKDYSECRIKATRPVNVIPKLQKDILRCMESRGYNWEVDRSGTLITGDSGWAILKEKK